MAPRPTVRCLLLLLLGSAGCQVLRPSRPVVVEARDAETRKPIAGAAVGLSYDQQHSYFGPSESRGTTGADGIARFDASPAAVEVSAEAPGYMPEEQFVSSGEMRPAAPSRWCGAGEAEPVTVVLEMYAADPRPAIDLVLPPGFRGLVRAEIGVAEDAPRSPGQRQFTYEVPADGSIRATVPPLFRHFPLPDIRGRYAEGPPLSSSAKGEEVGFWWLRSEGDVHTYLVGLESEYARSRPATGSSGAGKASGGGGKGRGRGGKRGGTQQPDTGAAPNP
jgi:hypothetical protein